MKRRSFLKAVSAGVFLPFLPKAKAKDLPALESDIYAPNNPNSKMKWRKYAPLSENLDPAPIKVNDVASLNDLEFYLGARWTQRQIKILKEIRTKR